MNKKNSLKKVIISAAGTGGHIVPGLAVAELMRDQGIEVMWLGGQRPLEKKLVTAAGFTFNSIVIDGLRGKNIKAWLLLPWRMLRALRQVYKFTRSFKPQAVLTFGGYVTGPVAVVARLRRLPLFLHEQNAIAGMTNSYLGNIATKVFTAFPDCFAKRRPLFFKNKIILAGNPLPKKLLNWLEGNNNLQRAQAHKSLRVLVLGGSQGCAFLNKNLPDVFGQLALQIPVSVRHQTGQVAAANVEDNYAAVTSAALKYQVQPFIDDVTAAYAWADCIICRSGAMTVSEVAAVGLPAIFVPFPYAVDDHQAANAAYLVSCGAAHMLRESEFSIDKINKWLVAWQQKPASKRLMVEAAKQASRINAADIMLNEINKHFI